MNIDNTAIRRKSLLADAEKAVEWLNSLDVDTSVGRIPHYLRCIEKLENVQPGSPSLPIHEYDAGTEAVELYSIYRGLEHHASPELITRLKKYVKGPYHTKDEKFDKGSTHHARNIGFELFVASRFALAGWKIQFPNEADIIVEDGKTIFQIECKRPSKHHTIKNCIKDAYTQLNRRYESAEPSMACRGLIAISLTKVINPNSEQWHYLNMSDIKDSLMGMLDKYVKEHRNMLYKKLHPMTMGAFFFMNAAITVPGYKGTIFPQYFVNIYLSETNVTNIQSGNPERVYFSEITQHLEKSMNTNLISDDSNTVRI